MVVGNIRKFISVFMSAILVLAITPSVSFAEGLFPVDPIKDTYENVILTQDGELIFFNSKTSYKDGNDFNQVATDINNVQYTGKIMSNKYNDYQYKYTDYSVTWTGNTSIYDEVVYGPWGQQDALKIKSVRAAANDTFNIETMHCLFDGCSNLTTVDFSGLGTSAVDRFDLLFKDCSKLTTANMAIDMTGANTAASMFEGCSALTNLNTSTLDVSKLVYMSSMFAGCKSLTSLNLSNFNTESMMDSSNMFKGCEKLETLDISNFDNRYKSASGLTAALSEGIFDECYNLKEIKFNSNPKFSTVVNSSENKYIVFPYGYWWNEVSGYTYFSNSMTDVSSKGSYLTGTYTRYNNVDQNFDYPDVENGLTYTGYDQQSTIDNLIKTQIAYNTDYYGSVKSEPFTPDTSNFDIYYSGDFTNINKAASVVVEGKNYLTGTKNLTININKASIKDSEVTSINNSYPYTGQEIRPVPVVTFNGKTLKENEDYTLSYSDNINVGTATISLDGLGNFDKHKEVYFNIYKSESPVTSNQIFFRKDLANDDYVIWEVDGSGLYIDNGKILPANKISKVSVKKFDSDSNLIEESYTTEIPNSDLDLSVDDEGRPSQFSGKNVSWLDKVNNGDNWNQTVKVSDSVSNLNVVLAENGASTVTGDSTVIDSVYGVNNNLNSVERTADLGSGVEEIEIFRGTNMSIEYSVDGTINVGSYVKRFNGNIKNNQIKDMTVYGYKNNVMMVFNVEGENINFNESDGIISGISKVEYKNTRDVVRNYKSNNTLTLTSLYDNSMNMSGVNSVSTYDDAGVEIDVYNSSDAMNITINNEGKVTEAKASDVDVEPINHELTISAEDAIYTGNESKPSIVVTLDSNKITKGFDYNYNNNVNAGQASVSATYKAGEDIDLSASNTFNIFKADNKTFNVTSTNQSINYGVTGAVAGVVKVTGVVGELRYEKISGVDQLNITKEGALAFNSALNAGKYDLVYKVIDAGNNNYNPVSKQIGVTVTINKLANNMTVKSNKSVYLTYGKNTNPVIYTVSGNSGTVSYEKISGSNSFSIKNGKLVFNGKPAAGSYKMSFNVKDDGGLNNNPKTTRIDFNVVVNKASNTVKATVKTVKVKKNSKKAQVIAKNKAFNIKNAIGKLTFTKIKKGSSDKLSITKAGKIKVAKNTPKGTYKIKVKIKAAGNKNYSSKTVTKTVKVNVK